MEWTTSCCFVFFCFALACFCGGGLGFLGGGGGAGLSVGFRLETERGSLFDTSLNGMHTIPGPGLMVYILLAKCLCTSIPPGWG